MTVCYVEIDDEITGAIARLRAVRDGEAIVVVPAGSHIATSRINFKLLAREGSERGLRVATVSDEPSVRALAISAGLPAYDSIPSAEKALANLPTQEMALSERMIGGRKHVASRTPAKKAPGVPDKTQLMLTLPLPPTTEAPAGGARNRATDWVIPTPTKPAGLATTGRESLGGEHPPVGGRPGAEGTTPDERTAARRRSARAAPIVGAVVLLLFLAGVGYGAYLFLPTATITLRPTTTELRPEPFTVVADANVAVVDPAAGVIPAEWVEVPLSVSGTFTATGVAARETRATGTVRFRSENTLNEVAIVEGTVVATQDGVEFETTQPAVVPPAVFATGTPGRSGDIRVRAVRPGPAGNVAAREITELPAILQDQRISVRNPDPTIGGQRFEQRVVAQEDYDAAVASLTGQLSTTLAARLADPAAVPRGLSVFPDTAQTGAPIAEPVAEDVVGTEAETFALALNTTATVLAVNEALIDDLAEARLRTLVQPGQQIVADRVSATHSTGTVSGETVSFQAFPSALVYTQPDSASLMAAVRGKSISEARQILSAYGMVEVSIWPDFVDRLPDQTARISLVVVMPSPLP